MTIWKFELPLSGSVSIDVPIGSQALAVASQRGKPFLWVRLDASRRLERREFTVALTGAVLDATRLGAHIGTVLLFDGEYVVHVFELKSKAAA